jgi:hypothetical protein
MTADVWDAQPPEVQVRWTTVGSFDGWAYADKGRKVTVLALRRLDVPVLPSTRPTAETPSSAPTTEPAHE